MGRLIKDVAVSLVVSGAVLTPIGIAVDNSSWPDIWFVLTSGVLILISPFLVMSLLLVRPGYALGYVLLFLIAPFIGFVEIEAGRARLKDLEVWPPTASIASQQIIFMSRRTCYGRDSCSDLRTAILHQRGDDVAIESYSSNRNSLFTKASGTACQSSTDETVRASVDFLAIGVTSTCWVRKEIDAVPNGIVITTRRAVPWEYWNLSGRVYEVSARHQGADTLLARRFEGRLRTHVPDIFLAPAQLVGVDLRNQRIGTPNMSDGFYRETLGVDLNPKRIDNDRLAASLRQLLILMETSGKYSGDAMNVFQELVEQGDDDQALATFPFVRALLMKQDLRAFYAGQSALMSYRKGLAEERFEIDRLLRSRTRDGMIFGLMRLEHWSGARLPAESQPFILDALQSSDPDLIFAALMAISYKNPEGRAFAEPALARVAKAPDPVLKWPLMRALGQKLPDLQ